MKYFLIISLFFISTLAPVKVHAGGIGSATMPMQLAQIGLETPTKIATIATALSTGQDMLKNVILDPIANALISSALKGASNSILGWVSGGFGGSDPLIISNPESFIRDRGLEAIRGGLAQVPTDSIFGDSIFNSVLSQYKGANDIGGILKTLSQSDVPSMIQESLCSDEELTTLATDALGETFSEADLTAKKAELWDYACIGDPNTDPQVATKLLDLSTQNPSIGGWDTFLAVSGGANAFTKAEIAKVKFAEFDAAKKQLASDEIFKGAGPVSERECTAYADVTDDTMTAECLEWSTVTPGKQVAATLDEALTAGTKRLENIMGSGSLTGMLQQFVMSAITTGIKKSLNSAGGTAKFNIAKSLPSSRPLEQDLADDPKEKADNLKPMDKQLDYYLKDLNSLADLDSKYLYEVKSYQGKVEALKDCEPARAYYNERMGRITPVRATLEGEQAEIAAARELVAETKARLQETNSSQEQGTIFNSYLEAVEDNGYPDSTNRAEREVAYNEQKNDVANDTELTTWQNNCTTTTSPVYEGSNMR